MRVMPYFGFGCQLHIMNPAARIMQPGGELFQTEHRTGQMAHFPGKSIYGRKPLNGNADAKHPPVIGNRLADALICPLADGIEIGGGVGELCRKLLLENNFPI